MALDALAEAGVGALAGLVVCWGLCLQSSAARQPPRAAGAPQDGHAVLTALLIYCCVTRPPKV